MKTAKVLELVEILKEFILPLTKSHISKQKYWVNTETHLEISSTHVSCNHTTLCKKHLEISISTRGNAMISLYSDFDDSGMDQLIADVVNTYHSRLSESALIEKLKKERDRIDFKIKSLEK